MFTVIVVIYKAIQYFENSVNRNIKDEANLLIIQNTLRTKGNILR